jgi:hypothetical protein
MKENLILLRNHYVNEIKNNDDFINNSGASEITITRLLIETNSYTKFVKQLDKIIHINENLSNGKKEQKISLGKDV